MARSTTTSLIFAALLLLQAVTSASAAFTDPVDGARRSAIVTENGPGAPFSQWHVRNEAHRFYLHHPGFATGSGTAPPPPPSGAPTVPPSAPTPATFAANLDYPTGNPNEASDRAIVVGSNDRTGQACVTDPTDIFFDPICPSTTNPYEFAVFKGQGTGAVPGSPTVLNTTVYSISGRLFIAGLPAQGYAYARVFQVDSAGVRVGANPFGGTSATTGAAFPLTPVTPIQAGSGRTPGPIEYQGRFTFGVDGVRLPAGHTFEFEVGTATADPTNPFDPQGLAMGAENIRGNLVGTPGALFMDTVDYPSSFSILSDAARLNMWTETRQGNPANAFSPANIDQNTPANVADRQFLVQVVQANAWGRSGFDPVGVPNSGGRADTVCGERGGLNPIFTSFTGRHALRMFAPDGTQLDIRSATPNFQTGSQQTGGASTAAGFKELDAGGTTLQKTWHFVYPSGYNATGVAKTPDGTYRIEAYNDCYQWKDATHSFIIGKREFEFTTALGESPHHVSLVGQATEYAFRVRNAGASPDTFQFAVPNLQGFTAQFSRTTMTLNPGEEQVVTLRLSPPGSVGNGDNKTFQVTAASLVTNQIKSVSISDRFTTVVSKGVEIVAAKSIVETRPGLTTAISVAVKNTGNAADRFLFRATGAPLGWSVTTSPATLDLLGSSRGDVLVQVTAPRDAVSGQAFTLQLEAVSANDLANRATLNLPVSIFLVRQVVIDPTIGATTVALRNQGPRNCQGADLCRSAGVAITGPQYTDTDVDQTSLLRYKLTNSGDLPANYTLKAYWQPGVNTSDCNGDGVPDRWRFNVDVRTVPSTTIPDIGTAFGGAQVGERRATGFSGLIGLGWLNIEPRQSKDVVVEVGYLSGDECGSGTTSQTARLVLQATDQNDPTFVVERGTSLERVSAGTEVVQNRFTGGQRAVALVNETNEKLKHFTPAGTATTYRIVAKNLGNEMDTLTVKLDAGTGGWGHSMMLDPVIGTEYLFNGARPNGGASPAGSPTTPLDEEPTIAGCPVTTNPRQISCTLGIRDEIHLLVTITPPAGVQSGTIGRATVTVVSQDDGNKFDDIVLETVVGGLFTYQASSPVTQLDVVRGQQALFPFTVTNIGNNADTIRFSVEQGPTAWNPTFSDPSGQTFLAPGGVQHGFLRVQAPANAPLNTLVRFLVKLENVADPDVPTDSTFRVLEFLAVPKAAGDLSMSAPPVLVPRGAPASLAVKARDLTGSATSVTMWVESARLPAGWSVTIGQGNQTTATVGADRNATATFQVTAPAGELSTSRVPVRVFGRVGSSTSFVDTEAVLASVFGVTVNATQPKVVTAPGVLATHTVRITNTGLDVDTYTISTSTPPSGWNVTLPQLSIALEPLQAKEFPVLVTPPAGAAPGTTGSVLLFASSAGDATKTAQTALLTEVGVRKPQVFGGQLAYAAPQETTHLVFEVLNNGTLADTIALTPVLAPEFRDQATVTLSNTSVALSPGRSEDILVRVTLPRTLQAGTAIPVTLRATASGATPPTGEATSTISVLGHSLRDVDGDLLFEMAVDRDRKAANGLEEFTESPSAGGRTTALADLERFLSETAKDRMSDTATVNGTATRILRYAVTEHCDGLNATNVPPPIDGDCDGKTDFLLDSNADGMPDAYWDPDLGSSHQINITKDVTGDQVRESFVDTTGDGVFDYAFDLVQARFLPLLSRDVDGDGKADYVVDLDGDGQPGPADPVVVSRSGGLVTLSRVDVDGNGQLDEVYDLDGDGNPESFVPAGKSEAYPIKLRDVTGDGKDDWTWDSDGDGKVDSYYDPATQQSGLIDQRSSFLRALEEHWYIGALFGVVLALFVVLLIVTRK